MNRLASETSPYLLQHKDNPVDWYPWGPEALERARTEDKPILLSVGYSACHWCHVMEHESFEDEQVARIMNEHFVCIKVDREERPDVDDVYMAATVAVSGSGGWPMTVFLTPEQTPFFAGTYFPKEDRFGRPGFRSLLLRIAGLWKGEREALYRQAAEIVEHLQQQVELAPARNVEADLIERAVAQLKRSFDAKWGGFGQAPKFPPCSALMLLMRYIKRSGDDEAMPLVRTTLDGMKNGGMYDQLGGGFARYSTDERWLVPHFEKMLYDNAQLARVYSEAFQLTGEPEYARVARETLDYMIAELELPSGGFASSTDADSEGEEGKFFVFTRTEIEDTLDTTDARAFCAYFDVTEAGNWEGRNVLNTPRDEATVAKELGMELEEFRQRIARARETIRRLRAHRTPPARDDKLLVSWNGLAIGALAFGAQVFGQARYRTSAERAARTLRTRLRRADGRLYRTAREGRAHLDGYLEDYAFLGEGLLDLYEATGDPLWFGFSHELLEIARKQFRDEATGAFFHTAHDQEPLIVRTRDGQDGAVPNANAVAAKTLFRLGRHLNDPALERSAEEALRAYGERLDRFPRAFTSTLCAVDFLLGPVVEIVVSGDDGSLARALATRFLPRRVFAFTSHETTPRTEAADDTGQDEAQQEAEDEAERVQWSERLAQAPLQQGRSSSEPTAFVCHEFHCEKPAHSVHELEEILDRVEASTQRQRKDALAPEPLVGRATLEGTRRYFARLGLPNSAHRELGANGLRVSRLGFGAYRIALGSAEHQRACMLALTSGCNLFDTAPTYMQGESEVVIGSALAELVRKGQLARDEVVVVTKVGLIQHETTEAPEENSADRIQLAPTLSYSFSAEQLDRQLTESLHRLGLQAIDVLLLHTPEAALSVCSKEVVLQGLQAAFSWLEQQVKRGRISCFGVSTNQLVLEPDPTRLTLGELLAAAKSASCRHFRVLELPLNPLELDMAGTNEAPSLLADAARRHLAVLTNRPLNAVRNEQLIRLIDAPQSGEPTDLEARTRELAQLEAEFASKLGRVLQAVPGSTLDPTEFFSWAERVSDYETSSRELWNEFEAGILGSELPRVLAAMNQAFEGKQLNSLWSSWRDRYVKALEQWILAARGAASEATNARNRHFAETLREAMPRPFAESNLAQQVLWHVSSVPEVTCTLVGMRRESYVQQALATLRWPEASMPLRVLRRASQRLDS